MAAGADMYDETDMHAHIRIIAGQGYGDKKVSKQHDSFSV